MGWGHNPDREDKYDAIRAANTPNMDSYIEQYPNTLIRADSEQVGLPESTMGSSEVGHGAIGGGRVDLQPVVRIENAIADGSFFKKAAFLEVIKSAKEKGKPLHLIGLVSNGLIHSKMNNIEALLKLAKDEGVKEVYVHAILDGRDTDHKSGAKDWLPQLQAKIDEIGIGKIVDIVGRYYSMDRDRNWDRIKDGWSLYIEGKADNYIQEDMAMTTLPFFLATVEGGRSTTVSDLLEKLKGIIDSNPEIKIVAAGVITLAAAISYWQWHKNWVSYEGLKNKLLSGTIKERSRAVKKLGKERSKEILFEEFRSSAAVRRNAARSYVSRIGIATPEELFQANVDVLRSSYPAAVKAAMEELAEFGNDALVVLWRMLKYHDYQVRRKAQELIKNMDHPMARRLKAIIARLKIEIPEGKIFIKENMLAEYVPIALEMAERGLNFRVDYNPTHEGARTKPEDQSVGFDLRVIVFENLKILEGSILLTEEQANAQLRDLIELKYRDLITPYDVQQFIIADGQIGLELAEKIESKVADEIMMSKKKSANEAIREKIDSSYWSLIKLSHIEQVAVLKAGVEFGVEVAEDEKSIRILVKGIDYAMTSQAAIVLIASEIANGKNLAKSGIVAEIERVLDDQEFSQMHIEEIIYLVNSAVMLYETGSREAMERVIDNEKNNIIRKVVILLLRRFYKYDFATKKEVIKQKKWEKLIVQRSVAKLTLLMGTLDNREMLELASDFKEVVVYNDLLASLIPISNLLEKLRDDLKGSTESNSDLVKINLLIDMIGQITITVLQEEQSTSYYNTPLADNAMSAAKMLFTGREVFLEGVSAKYVNLMLDSSAKNKTTNLEDYLKIRRNSKEAIRRFLNAVNSDRKIVLEVGTGRGMTAANIAQSNPEMFVIGIESDLDKSVIDLAKVRAGLRGNQQAGIHSLMNLVPLHANSQAIFQALPDNSVDHLLFVNQHPEAFALIMRTQLEDIRRILQKGGEITIKMESSGVKSSRDIVERMLDGLTDKIQFEDRGEVNVFGVDLGEGTIDARGDIMVGKFVDEAMISVNDQKNVVRNYMKEKGVFGYSSTKGIEGMRELLSRFAKQELGLSYTPEQTIIAPGREHILKVLRTVLTDFSFLGLAEIDAYAEDFNVDDGALAILNSLVEDKLSAVVIKRRSLKENKNLLNFWNNCKQNGIVLILDETNVIRTGNDDHDFFEEIIREDEDARQYLVRIVDLSRRIGGIEDGEIGAVFSHNKSIMQKFTESAQNAGYTNINILMQEILAKALNDILDDETKVVEEKGESEIESVNGSGVIDPIALSVLKPSATLKDGPTYKSEKALRLDAGASTYPVSEAFVDGVLGAIGKSKSELIGKLNKVYLTYLQRSRGLDYTDGKLIFGKGLKDLIASSLVALSRYAKLHNKKLSVTSPIPYWSSYKVMARRVGASFVGAETSKENNAKLTRDVLEKTFENQEKKFKR